MYPCIYTLHVYTHYTIIVILYVYICIVYMYRICGLHCAYTPHVLYTHYLYTYYVYTMHILIGYCMCTCYHIPFILILHFAYTRIMYMYIYSNYTLYIFDM